MILTKKITNQKVVFGTLNKDEVKILKEVYNFFVESGKDHIAFVKLPEELEGKVLSNHSKLVNRGYIERGFNGNYRFHKKTFDLLHSFMDKSYAELVGLTDQVEKLRG